METKTCFVAYASQLPKVSECIAAALTALGKSRSQIIYEDWRENDIAGRPLIAPVLEKINNSTFVIADITSINLNVTYEIGYAIGVGKRTILVRNTSIIGDSEIYARVGIFDTLGFEGYENEEELVKYCRTISDVQPLPTSYVLDLHKPLYFLETPKKSQALGKMVSAIKRARYRYRSFNPSEESRISAIAALEQVGASYGIILPWLSENEVENLVHNTRAAFIAGLAHGMEKPTLILYEHGQHAPLDIRDFSKSYKFPEDIGFHIAEWIPQVAEAIQRTIPLELLETNFLQRLRMGDPMAENEFGTLQRYYIYTDQFDRATSGEVTAVVGRKGSGKTALWTQLRDQLRAADRRLNIVLDLKPEGYQLLKFREEVLDYLTEGAKAHLITAFWEYLLLLEIAFKILEKDEIPHMRDNKLFEPYERLKDLFYVEGGAAEGDFSERLLTLASSIGQRYKASYGGQDEKRLATEEITNLLYTHDIRELRQQLSAYLKLKKSIWVLFDNLDKGWSSQGLSDTDYLILRCLIDAGRKLKNDFGRDGHVFQSIVFVRDDVYQRLVEMSPDFGKDLKAALDWSDPDLLREMIRRRIVANDLPSNATFEAVWSQIVASHVQGAETSQFMIDRCMMRPRYLLKLFSHCRGAAINFGHNRIEPEDIVKGSNAFSRDLVVDADQELADMIPSAEGFIYHFEGEGPYFSEEDLFVLMEMAGLTADTREPVLEFLRYYGIIGIVVSDEEVRYIYDFGYNMTRMSVAFQKAGGNARYSINPALWAGMNISELENSKRRTS